MIGEARKQAEANRGVIAFVEISEPVFLSSISVGELRRGVELVRDRGDADQARRLEAWLTSVAESFGERILDRGLVTDRLRKEVNTKRALLIGVTLTSFIASTSAKAQPWVSCDLTITHPVASGTLSSGGDVKGNVRHYEMAETGDNIWSDSEDQDVHWHSSSSNGKITFNNDFVKIVAKGQGTFGNQKTWKAALIVNNVVNAEGSCNWTDQE